MLFPVHGIHQVKLYFVLWYNFCQNDTRLLVTVSSAVDGLDRECGVMDQFQIRADIHRHGNSFAVEVLRIFFRVVLGKLVVGFDVKSNLII